MNATASSSAWAHGPVVSAFPAAGSVRYAPVSAIGWRPQTGRVLPGSAAKTGAWVEGMSLRRDIDQLDTWAFAVAA